MAVDSWWVKGAADVTLKVILQPVDCVHCKIIKLYMFTAPHPATNFHKPTALFVIIFRHFKYLNYAYSLNHHISWCDNDREETATVNHEFLTR